MERSFAHVCETGGARRSWIRGLPEVAKRYLMQVAGHNLGILMRTLFGIGKPRALQGSSGAFARLCATVRWLTGAIVSHAGPSSITMASGRRFHRLCQSPDTLHTPRLVAA